MYAAAVGSRALRDGGIRPVNPDTKHVRKARLPLVQVKTDRDFAVARLPVGVVQRGKRRPVFQIDLLPVARDVGNFPYAGSRWRDA